MNAQATVVKAAVSYTRVASAMKKSQLESQTPFFAALLLQGFNINTVSEGEVVITNNVSNAQHTALVVGSKLVILMGDTIKKNGLALKMNRSLALDTFAVSQNAYVLDLDTAVLKGAKAASGWVPAEGVEKDITIGAIMAVSNTTIVSTKPVDGPIEHVVVGQGKSVATDSIVEVRATLTSIIEENGGFIVVEQAPKVRKPRNSSLSPLELALKQEQSKGTSAEALRVEAAHGREARNAETEVHKDAKLAQKIRTRQNAEALKYAA